MPLDPADTTARALFAGNLRRLRIAKGFRSASEFARTLGIDQNRYTRYERAEVEPNLSVFLKICDALQSSPNELLKLAQSGVADTASPANGSDKRQRP